MHEYKAGHIVFGRYLLDRPIARGGMGSVWVATDRKLKREVAVKLMFAEHTASEAARQRFESEAMMVAKLKSPHIVQIYDYGVDHHSPFIVMELLSGEDLNQRLKREKRLSLQEVGRILVHAALGLDEAHATGLIHRDLKPGNIFLVRTRSGELCKILDFGVAKASSDPSLQQVEPERIVGTPQFMSPEQIRQRPDIGARSDLFSLGVIIYRALTGMLPFRGKTPREVCIQICKGDYSPPSTLGPGLPTALDDFMRVALAVNPTERFATARDMVEAFARITPESYDLLVSSLNQPGLPTAPVGLHQSGGFPVGLHQSGGFPVGLHQTGPYSVDPLTGWPPQTGSITGVGRISYNPATGGGPPSIGAPTDAGLLTTPTGVPLSGELDDAITMVRSPRRKVLIAIGAVAALVVVALIGSFMIGPDEVPAAPPPSATAPAASTTSDSEAAPSASATAAPADSAAEVAEKGETAKSAKKKVPRAGLPPATRPPPAQPPPPPADGWDPFKSRK